ncbi:MAG: hypothetical protein ABEI99_11730, partial [Halobaculum sp.]
MQSPSRRALLGTLATLPLAGCVADDSPGTPVSVTPTDSPTDDRPPSDSPTDDSTPTDSSTDDPPTTQSESAPDPVVRQPGESYQSDDLTVTVSEPTVRHGMVSFRGGAHPDPLWEANSQFVLATVATEGGQNPPDLDVTLTADTLDERPETYYGYGGSTAESVEQIGFAVPTDPSPSEAAVVWNGPREVRWPLPDELVRKLGRAPDFSLEGFRVPESAPKGTDIDVTLEVTNDGDRDGQFLAELGTTGISDHPEIRVAVPAGE